MITFSPPSSLNRIAVSVGVLAAITIAVRIVFLYVFPPLSPYSDMGVYDAHAWRLAQGMGYVRDDGLPTAYWPIGYPFFLSLVYRFCGHATECGYFANVLLQTLTVIVVYFLCIAFSHHLVISFATASMLALYPDNIAFSGLILSEPLYTVLILLGTALTTIAVQRLLGNRDPILSIFLAGIAFGMATLVRPLAIFLAPVVIVTLLLNDFSLITSHPKSQFALLKKGKIGVLAFILLIGVMLPVGVWSLRNYRVFEQFILVSTNGGVNLFIGNHALATGTYTENQQISALFTEYPSESQRDSKARQEAMEFIAGDLRAVITNFVPSKLWHMFKNEGDGLMFAWQAYSIIPFGDPEWEQSLLGLLTKATIRFRSIAYLLVATGFCAYCLLIIPGRLPWFPLSVTIYHVLITVVFFGTPRYREPLIPFWLIGIACLSSYLLHVSRSSAMSVHVKPHSFFHRGN